jgi:hypothetical protein
MNIGEWYYFIVEKDEWKIQLLSPLEIGTDSLKVTYIDLSSAGKKGRFYISSETGGIDTKGLWRLATDEQFHKAIRIIFK